VKSTEFLKNNTEDIDQSGEFLEDEIKEKINQEEIQKTFTAEFSAPNIQL